MHPEIILFQITKGCAEKKEEWAICASALRTVKGCAEKKEEWAICASALRTVNCVKSMACNTR
jgi:hypothetical protein